MLINPFKGNKNLHLMKKTIFTLLLVGIISTSYAQSQSFNNKLNLGIDLYSNGNGLKFTYNHFVNDIFTIGLGSTFYFNNKDNDFFLYGRGTMRLNPILDLPKEFDIYPGLELGYLSPSGIGLTGFIGFSYRFNHNLSGFVELGNNGSLGVSIDL